MTTFGEEGADGGKKTLAVGRKRKRRKHKHTHTHTQKNNQKRNTSERHLFQDEHVNKINETNQPVSICDDDNDASARNLSK